MLFSMQLLCFYKQPPTPLFASLLSPHSVHSDSILKNSNWRVITKPFPSYSCGCIVQAVKEDNSQQYEVDPVKAREALQQLDQQLQSLSNKQVSSPKVTVSDVKLTEEQANVADKKLEISDSFLAYLAAGLILFTIFYNVLFYTVIKPSIDGS